MNTTQCNKIDALLNFDIPKKDQQPRAHLLNVTCVDTAQIMMSRIYPLTTKDNTGIATKHCFTANKECETIRECMFDTMNEYPFIFIDRKRLLATLNAMDSRIVKIRMAGETPLLITGVMDHDVMVESVIAPILCKDEAGVDYYE